MGNNKFDAIVVGSGVSGGWAAKELCEKGLKVLLLERGGPYEHIKDYKTAMKDPWEFEHRGYLTAEQKRQKPVVSKSGYANEGNIDGYVNDIESPYTEVKPYSWWARSYRMGGRSTIWGRQSYRLSAMDFEANEKEGIAVPWPIGYADIAPWYDHVEKFAGISGSMEGLAQLPDGHFLPAMELNCVEKDVAERLKKHYNGSRCLIIGRTANITTALQGRTPCQYRNRCSEGCPFGGYFSTQSSTLPAAVATGNLTVRPHSIVTQVLYNKDTQKARGVEVLDAATNKTYEFESKIVFLCASALNSTWILLNSAKEVWPGGLGSSSGQLGHNFMDHHYNVGASGTVEGFEDKYVYGRRANGFYIPRFVNLAGDKRDYLRGFGYQGGAGRSDWQRDVGELSVGADFKEALTEPGPWSIGGNGFGEMLPYYDNKVTLDANKKDKWGLPVLAIDMEIKENELKMRKDMATEMKAMLEAAGVKNVSTYDKGINWGGGHEMGTARMGHDPKTSVLNKWNQVWDCKNVFVTDGACMTSSACQNPTLTYMALTARAVDYAVKEMNKQNL